MPKKLAIDWSDSELRLVAAQCSGGSVKVTEAAVIPFDTGNVAEALKSAISQYGLEKAETLVTIGRGKAELRELQLPPVPDEELPDMVRFQAIRSFASAGESAVVDYLLTNRTDHGVEMIAAAVSPSKLDEITKLCQSADLVPTRIALRPLAAAALYLEQSGGRSLDGETVLIDLLEDDAEIVVARDGQVVFVRTVRMTNRLSERRKALVAELRRSLVACGSSGSPQRILLWGLKSVHQADVDTISEALRGEVDVIDPFDLVEVDRRMTGKFPDHVGRLAPLVGLLACDETAAHQLIDFLNPRQRVEEVPDHRRNAVLVGIPLLAVILLGWFSYRYLQKLDHRIDELTSSNAAMREPVEAASRSVQRTELIDQFLDGDANWLTEITRMADAIPPAEEMILRSISASTDSRSGVSTLTLVGSATDPDVIDLLEESLRDENHRVIGDGASEQKTEDAYRWDFTEKVSVLPEFVRGVRYEGIARQLASDTPEESDGDVPDPHDEAEGDSVDAPETQAETSQEPTGEQPARETNAAEAEPSETSGGSAGDPEQTPPTPAGSEVSS